MPQSKSSSKKSTSSSKSSVQVTENTPVSTETTAQEPVQVESTEPAWEERFKTIDSSLKQVIALAKTLQSDVRKLHKDYSRQHRELTRRKNRRNNRNKNDGSPRPLSGFARPTEISDNLAKFLGEKKGTLLARTDVTKRITCYIKDHSLQNPENKRQIQADAPLRKLLGLNTQDVLTFFNLQKYMKVHFLKKEQPVSAA